MNKPHKFFLVWSPQGETSPRKRHRTWLDAKNEAYRLSLENPGKSYFIVKGKGVHRNGDFYELQGAEPLNLTASQVLEREKEWFGKFPEPKPFPDYLKPNGLEKIVDEMLGILTGQGAKLKTQEPDGLTERERHEAKAAQDQADRIAKKIMEMGAGDIIKIIRPSTRIFGEDARLISHIKGDKVPSRFKGLSAKQQMEIMVADNRCMAVHFADKFTVYAINAVELPDDACVDEIVKTIKLENPQAIVMVFGQDMRSIMAYPADDLAKFDADVPSTNPLPPRQQELHPLVKAVREVIMVEQLSGILSKGPIVLLGKPEEYGVTDGSKQANCCGRQIIFSGCVVSSKPMPTPDKGSSFSNFSNWQG